MRNKKGFTLIELMVVISIIGILALMMTTYYSRVQQKAHAMTIIDDIQTIRYAANNYKSDYGEWPPDTWWGEIPQGLEPYLLDNFSFDRPDLSVKYSFDNYENTPNYANYYGVIVTVSINSPDESLLASVKGLVSGMFEEREGFFGWKRLIFNINTYDIS